MSGEFGQASADAIEMVGDEVAANAELARQSNAGLAERLAAKIRTMAAKQGGRDKDLAHAVGQESYDIEQAVEIAGNRWSADSKKMDVLKEILKEEEKGSHSNAKYLFTLSQQNDEKTLNMLHDILHGISGSVEKYGHVEEEKEMGLFKVFQALERATGGEAFKTLQRIAGADEYAMATSTDMETMTYWMNKYEKETVHWRQGVRNVLVDLGKGQEVDHLIAIESAAQLKAAGKNTHITLPGSHVGDGLGAIEGTMNTALDNMNTLRHGNEAKLNKDLAAVGKGIANEHAQGENNIAASVQQLNKLKGGNEAAHNTLMGMDSVMTALHEQQEQRLAQEGKRRDTRARELDEALFDVPTDEKTGSLSESSKVKNLKALVQQLDGEHKQLETRHTNSGSMLGGLINKITNGLHLTTA